MCFTYNGAIHPTAESVGFLARSPVRKQLSLLFGAEQKPGYISLLSSNGLLDSINELVLKNAEIITKTKL